MFQESSQILTTLIQIIFERSYCTTPLYKFDLFKLSLRRKHNENVRRTRQSVILIVNIMTFTQVPLDDSQL